MRIMHSLTLAALLCAPAFAAPTDTMLVRKTHTDPYTAGGKEMPAKDGTQTIWVAKDRVRMDSEENSVILRLDEKKMYMVDPKEKTYSIIELPFNMKKYMPPEISELYDKMTASNPMTTTVTATDETKKIHDWTAKKFVVSMKGGGMSEDVWTTTDIAMDMSAFNDLMRLRSTMMPGGETAAEEMKKLTGVPVLTDRTQTMGGMSIKTREELVSVEQKDAPAGSFEPPKDYTEQPFDPMPKAAGGHRPPGGKGPPGKGPPPPKQP